MIFKVPSNLFGNIRKKLNPLLKFPEYREVFYQDIFFNNFNRLRYWSYFLIALTCSQLYTDLTVKGIYTAEQTDIFLKADIVLAFVTLLVFFLTHFYRPAKSDEINLLHKSVIVVYLLFHLSWGAAISATESITTNGLPTYLIGVFSAATIFYTRGSYFILYLISSLITLYFMLDKLLPDKSKIWSEYYSIFTLIIIAWVVSKIIHVTKLNTFIATKKLEETNLNLDKTVKERTSELSNSNEQLMKEISERKKYERELLVAVKNAEEADRLKTVFLANMSHEIRTPLNGILGFGDLLSRGDVPPDRTNKYIDIIMNSGQQLLRIIDDILDISLIESNQLKIHKVPFALNKKIDEVFEFFDSSKKSLGKNNILLNAVKSLPDGQDLILTDPFRLQQVLNNLLKNAFKFTYNGKIEFGYTISDNKFRFFVSDTGIGIDTDKRELIFERFRQGDETLKRSYGGTGLGLSISKGIVEQLGGKIWLDSTFIEGSKFFFTIPQNSAEAQKTSSAVDSK